MSKESIYRNYQPAVTPDAGYTDSAYWFVFCSNKLLVKLNPSGIPCLTSPAELNLVPIRTEYLGTLNSRPCHVSEVMAGTNPPQDMSFMELRSLYGVLDEDVFLLAGKAIQIVNWAQTHQYCGRCGQKTHTIAGERVKKCPDCGLMSYPRISPAVITAILREDKILLSRLAISRGNMHTIIAGFVEPGETLEECAKREIMEEVGIQVKNIKYYGSQPWPFPNSLMIGFTADYNGGEIKVDGKEIAEAGWYGIDNLPELPPKMSIAREIIEWFVRSRGGKA